MHIRESALLLLLLGLPAGSCTRGGPPFPEVQVAVLSHPEFGGSRRGRVPEDGR
jgi:hypothetical protein